MVPLKPFVEVFHDSIRSPGVGEELSGVVVGLRELLTGKTNDGAMLDDFLEANFESLELSDEVRNEILKIKEETANEWNE